MAIVEITEFRLKHQVTRQPRNSLGQLSGHTSTIPSSDRAQ